MQQFAKVLEIPLTFFFEGAPEANVTSDQNSGVTGAITPAYATNFMASREGQNLMKAFSQIDRKLIRTIVDLAEELATTKSGRSR